MNRLRFSYAPFFRTLQEKGLSQNRFMLEHELSNALLDRIRHDKNMTLLTLLDILYYLDEIDLDKIVEVINEEEEKKGQ